MCLDQFILGLVQMRPKYLLDLVIGRLLLFMVRSAPSGIFLLVNILKQDLSCSVASSKTLCWVHSCNSFSSS